VRVRVVVPVLVSRLRKLQGARVVILGRPTRKTTPTTSRGPHSTVVVVIIPAARWETAATCCGTATRETRKSPASAGTGLTEAASSTTAAREESTPTGTARTRIAGCALAAYFGVGRGRATVRARRSTSPGAGAVAAG
jgi:hypothetical protein